MGGVNGQVNVFHPGQAFLRAIVSAGVVRENLRSEEVLFGEPTETLLPGRAIRRRPP